MSGHREIAFDTETTGFHARGDDRITEIGCVELIDLLPSGNTWHTYVNPERDVPEKVTEITGLTTEFLKDKPLFADIAQSFRDFVQDSPLVAHNASFDRGFINAELERANHETIHHKLFIDTLEIARAKFPGASNTLDALCKRFEISLASRETHGALVDAQLLAQVYLELKGGRARTFDLQSEEKAVEVVTQAIKARPHSLPPRVTEAEKSAHENFIHEVLGDGAIWLRGKT